MAVNMLATPNRTYGCLSYSGAQWLVSGLPPHVSLRFKSMLYTGSESAAAKRRTKNAFISGECPLIFMSLRSGAGVDGLQVVCHTAVIGEFDWSPQVHKQLIGRLRRPGQTEQVDAIYAHTNGGSDPVLVEMLGLKASQSAGIVDPYRPQPTNVSDDSRMRKLAAHFLEKQPVQQAEGAGT